MEKGTNFWAKLKKPFTVLAPMEDVTDTVFRQVMVKAGRPEVFFSEFTSVDGIDYAIKKFGGREAIEEMAQLMKEAWIKGEMGKMVGWQVLNRLVYTEIERPVVAQIWGKDPEKFEQAAELIKELGFDGVDINMGCPDRAVIKQGCGAALSAKEEWGRVREIVEATKEGAEGLPVSLKTRLGNKKVEEGWMEFLLEQGLAAMAVHARTAKEMSLVPARWEEIKRVVEARESLKVKTRVIGNGDIKSIEDERIEISGVDGVMIGRGVFENPWVFIKQVEMANEEARRDRIALLKYHLELWRKWWQNNSGEGKPYLKDYGLMKKFFKMYIRDWEGAAELRSKLMETNRVERAVELLSEGGEDT